METKITIVVDNKSSDGIPGEWGLSILVEYAGKRILLDAGASNLFLENMKTLGFEVSDVDYAVLSHAHYDHANGLPAFFENNEKAKLYIREHTDADCYSKKVLFKKYIGIPRGMLKKYADRIESVSGDYKLMDGVWLIPHKTQGLESIGKRELMFRKTSRGWVPDDFSHEQSLVLDTDKGLVILNSCSHGGAGNIINEVKSTFPDKKVYGLIGGLHLFNKSEDEIKEVAGKIRDTGIEYICTGHCTKERAFGILKEELGDVVDQMKVGYRMVI
ncbi:MAG: MBL fold metallo-hydrolase [Lachnospiraceae bacterium]|nr:MBL fold metallo-hydrolase [Lachnospiraceae bacterium]